MVDYWTAEGIIKDKEITQQIADALFNGQYAARLQAARDALADHYRKQAV